MCKFVVFISLDERKRFVMHLPVKNPQPRLEVWSERDAELAAAVHVEADKIRALSRRPVLISATLIAENLEITHVWRGAECFRPTFEQALLGMRTVTPFTS